MASFSQFTGVFNTIIAYLKQIERHLKCASCGGSVAVTTAGAGTSVPEGLKSVAIVKTSASDNVTITLSDASTYIMTQQGEVFVQAASPNGTLPAYTIAGPGTWKWHGIK